MPNPTAIVILGASGDLARHKLIPALSRLYARGLLCSECLVVGSGRTAFTDEEFRARFEIAPQFSQRLFYHTGIAGLKKFLDSKGEFSTIIFFMALPPAEYAPKAHELRNEGFGAEARLIVEKPFGYDYESARMLNTRLAECFSEEQIFRIDHYLAKEAVQNILVFRFANSLFEPVWNSHYIESIQINAFETVGVAERGAYFDRAGILRDMVQNHLMQLLCLLTMEAPVSLSAEDIRSQKIAVLKALKIDQCLRGQYRGYRQEKNVRPDSATETYAEVQGSINTMRWSGTPVYIRTGKALNRKGTEIGVKFRPLPHILFNEAGGLKQNRIIFKIQPAEGIILDLSSKVPGGEMRIAQTTMAFCYRDAFADEIPEAYQKLLQDAIAGDRTLFVGAEETEMAWKTLGPVLDGGEIMTYEPGHAPPARFCADWINFEEYQSAC
jgi:glucose-6-phosphate 1-dehydrogenase